MRTDFVLEGEGLNELSARLRVPACMLMRANGLYSPAWLLPGREIIVPEGQCRGPIPCPRETFARAIGADEAFLHPGEDTAALCRRLRLPVRLALLAFERRGGELREGETIDMSRYPARRRVYACGAEDTAAGVAALFGLSETKLRADNALMGAVYPGMELLIDLQ